MSKSFLAPAEIAEATIAVGIKKANNSPLNMILLGIFAGIFIGFGGHADITIMQTFSNIDPGFAKFLGGAVFGIGLILVLIAGAELFTGNCLMTMALADKKITLKQMLTNWVLVYLGNFIGSLILVFLLIQTGVYKEGSAPANLALSIAAGKTTATFAQVFIKAILANILVVLAVWMSFGAQDLMSKVAVIWFPIMTFVMVGCEHSIANMFFVPLAKYIGYDISWLHIWTKNLIPATLGNIVGGAIVVPLVYFVVYIIPKRKTELKESQEKAAN